MLLINNIHKSAQSLAPSRLAQMDAMREEGFIKSSDEHATGILDEFLDLDQERHGLPPIQQTVVVCEG